MTAHKGRQKIGAVFNGSTYIRAIYEGTHRVFYKWRHFAKIYTASGSITIPATAANIQVWCVGGGGSGGGWWYPNDVIVGGGGGGAGGFCYKNFGSSLAGKTISFTVGKGGVGGAGLLANGNKGSASLFFGLVANGGDGGSYNQSGGVGGSGNGGNVNNTGSTGRSGGINSYGSGAPGWNINGTYYGGGGDAGNGSSSGKDGCIYITYDY